MILQREFPFVRDDLVLVAWIDTETGKQKILMERRAPATGDVLYHDEVECIHTAVVDVPAAAFPGGVTTRAFAERVIQIRTTENLAEVDLAWEEKFKALQSWVAGIAEAGTGAFRLQREIERAGHLMYPVSWKLMRFLALVDPGIMLEYVDDVDRACRREGVRHEACLIANLLPLLDMMMADVGALVSESSTGNLLQLETADLAKFRPIITALLELRPPVALFLEKPRYAVFLTFPGATTLPGFRALFAHETPLVRKMLILNPGVTRFPEFRQFLSKTTEPDPAVRALAAHHSRAADFPEFRAYLSIATENATTVRAIAAEHPGAAEFPEFANFLSHRTEPRAKVRKAAAQHPGAPAHPEFRNFLSYHTEPEPRVRVLAAQNPGALELPEYAHFLSDESEPDALVRITATRLHRLARQA